MLDKVQNSSDELWKDVVGYEGLYQVSNLGNVKRLKGYHCKEDRYLAFSVLRGYYHVNLHKDGKIKTVQIHRLVAQAFVPNPENYPQVNHRDEEKTNNCADNLEWCTSKYNCNYGCRNSKIGEKSFKRPIKQVFKDGTFKLWNSAREADKHGYDYNSIYRCCVGLRKTHKGCEWQYAT